MKIIVAGATGLVGRQVADELAELDKVDVDAIVRTDPGNLPPDCWVHEVQPQNWGPTIVALHPDIAICCLGTTWAKSGKSEDAFRAVDLDLVLEFAKAAREGGARHMVAVSSVGADSKASNFYLRTKGQAEDGLSAMNFSRLDIIRPGLLTGGQRKETRYGEQLGILISPLTNLLLLGGLSKYQSIPSAKVAQAIVTLALAGGHGRFIHMNDEIRALAG
jgi:uncharacterized protein YbjT (DUF2867 family)